MSRRVLRAALVCGVLSLTPGLAGVSALAWTSSTSGSRARPATLRAPVGPPGFSDTVVLDVAAPTALAWTPDGRMLVTGQAGRLTVSREGQLPNVALDLRRRVCSQRERGLLGVAVDPDFASNHFVYLYYTHKVRGACGGAGNPDPQSRVGRFVLDDDTIDVSGEKVIVEHLRSPEPHHLAGDLEFGDDGYLYVSVGDGVCSVRRPRRCGALNPNAQDLSIPLGKVLRVDRDGLPAATNPYTGAPHAHRCTAAGAVRLGAGPCKEVFARGFRNPFRFARKPGTSTFYVNDVGLDTWEEIDRLRARGNFGWNIREGSCRRGSVTRCGRDPRYLDPIFGYRHADDCRAITGGAFVPGMVWPGYDGAYLFADFACGRIFRLRRNDAGDLVKRVFLDGLSGPTHLRFGPYGATSALYYASYFGNEVHRVALAGSNTPPVADFVYRPDGLEVTLDGSASADPDTGDSVSRWHWAFGDGDTANSTGPVVTHTYPSPGAFDVTLTVRDRSGTDSDPVTRTVQAGEHAPDLQITAPAVDARFAVGQRVDLAATATDPEDGTLPGSSMSWTVTLHHGNHEHPFASPVSGSSTSLLFPEPETLTAAATSYLLATVTVTDSSGISSTVVRRLRPHRVRLDFDSRPHGARLVVQGVRMRAPFAVTSWASYGFPVRARDQRIAGLDYTFQRWADGGRDNPRIILTPRRVASFRALFARR